MLIEFYISYRFDKKIKYRYATKVIKDFMKVIK